MQTAIIVTRLVKIPGILEYVLPIKNVTICIGNCKIKREIEVKNPTLLNITTKRIIQMFPNEENTPVKMVAGTGFPKILIKASDLEFAIR